MSLARRSLARLLATLALGLILAAPAAHAGAPPLERVIVVVMENQRYDVTRVQSYTQSLSQSGVLFTNSWGVTHPSQPNYIALWAGALLNVTNNNCPAPNSPFFSQNLGRAAEMAGVSWRAYSENLAVAGSAACSYDGSTSSGLYTRKHAPWTQFGNLNHANERPYADLAADIAANQVPRLVFVIPNNCHNSHNTSTPGCGVADGDAWLAANVPSMLAALGPRGLLILTWDEDDNLAGNHITTVFAGPAVLSGVVSAQFLSHYTINRLICEALGLPLMGVGGSEASILGVWSAAVPGLTTTWGKVKAHYR